jgi:1-acyl-sn-glycerol-3-phosphate acyltransferase
MLRACLLVYPFLAVYVTLATLIFVPLTWIIRDIRPIYWASRTGVRLALWLSGVRVKLVNPENAFEHPTNVFVCNHISNLDPPALFMVLPRIAVILKKELGRIPLLGYVMSLGGFIYVDRKDRDSRGKAMQAGVDTLRRGIALLVFPEGTRSPDGKLLPFRPGPFSLAIEAGVPLVPITVHGTEALMPKGRLSIKPGRIALKFHPAVATAGLGGDDRGRIMENVRETMRAAVEQGVPLD